MKKKISIIFAILIIVAIAGTIIYVKSKEEKPEEVVNQYISLINNQKYEEMYEKITDQSKQKISQSDFTKRNKNIYQGIDAYDIKIEIKGIEKDKEDKTTKVNYTETMSTSAGNITFDNTAKLKKEKKQYKIVWSSSQIFPQLRDNDKVRISTIKASRGEILDRNGNKLAENGKISSIGIVPGKLGENKEENIKKISELTGVSEDYIKKQISASYVKDDTFVPIKKIAMNNTNLKEQLLQIPGVMINSTDARVYPYGKEASHITGYVQPISAEILAEKDGKGYNSSSIIGKTGLESAYEDKIRGIDGVEIYIEDSEGNKLKEIAKQDKQY